MFNHGNSLNLTLLWLDQSIGRAEFTALPAQLEALQSMVVRHHEENRQRFDKLESNMKQGFERLGKPIKESRNGSG